MPDSLDKAGQGKAGWPVVTVVRASEESSSRFHKAFIGEEPGSAYTERGDLYQVERYLPESTITGLVEALEGIGELTGPYSRIAAKARAALSSYKQEVE